MPICFQFQKKHIDRLAKMTFSMSELNRTTKLLIETDEEDPDAAPQKSAKEIEEEKKAEKDAQQKMVSLFSYFFPLLSYHVSFSAKNDRRNSRGTLRQKFNLIDI